ncbi:hypothetical protein [PinkBerry-associated phage LS06-2018-MD08]|nr:hypothetical protein [PinkBerry-associated phage LS06-2018-MD08]
MLKLFSWGFKTIPSIWYIVKMNLFIWETVSTMPRWLKVSLTYGLSSFLVLSVLLYFTYFRDKLIRQKAREQYENEESDFTVKVQTIRMFRIYILIGLISLIVAMIFYFYKPYFILLFIKLAIIFCWFIAGEIVRIISIGKANNKEIVKKLKQKKENSVD